MELTPVQTVQLRMMFGSECDITFSIEDNVVATVRPARHKTNQILCILWSGFLETLYMYIFNIDGFGEFVKKWPYMQLFD